MKPLEPNSSLLKLPDGIKIAITKDELKQVAKLRKREFGRLYPALTKFEDDYDATACVLYDKNKDEKIISTGRIVFDSPHGLPADELVPEEINKLRQQQLHIAELSKFTISHEASGVLGIYHLAYCAIAEHHDVDYLVFIVERNKTKAYKKIADASVLAPDIGYSYGTGRRFSLLGGSLSSIKNSVSHYWEAR